MGRGRRGQPRTRGAHRDGGDASAQAGGARKAKVKAAQRLRDSAADTSSKEGNATKDSWTMDEARAETKRLMEETLQPVESYAPESQHLAAYRSNKADAAMDPLVRELRAAELEPPAECVFEEVAIQAALNADMRAFSKTARIRLRTAAGKMKHQAPWALDCGCRAECEKRTSGGQTKVKHHPLCAIRHAMHQISCIPERQVEDPGIFDYEYHPPLGPLEVEGFS